MIQKAGGDLENTRYWLNLCHPGQQNADGFWIKHKTYKMADGYTLLDKIAEYGPGQGIALDEPMVLSMTIFKTG
ncbi:unnamed protein product [Caenorhabditis nigoni]